MENFNWKIKKTLQKSKARLGRISKPHGVIETPAFIFCATKAALKAMSTSQAEKNKTQIILELQQEQ